MRKFLRLAWLLAPWLFSTGNARAAAETPPASQAILLIDDHFIESQHGVVRVVNQPRKRPNPVLRGGPKWDQNPYLFGTVLRNEDGSGFRMWYMSYNHGEPVSTRTPVLYATSKDGIKWERPQLGIVEFEGSKANNILFFSFGKVDQYNPTVVHDPSDKDPARRYKMAVWDNAQSKDSYDGGGMYVLFSPDGIRWTRQGESPVLRTLRQENAVSDVIDVSRDPVTGKFLLFAKGWEKTTWDQPDTAQRIIVRSESDDFVRWTEPQVVFRHAFTLSDPQSYGMPVFHYEGMYLGLMRSYKLPGDERMDVRLAVSRDSRAWKMVTPEHTFLPTSDGDQHWDDGMVMASPPVADGDRLLFYYGGWDGPHQSRYRDSNIGLAELPRDRFAAITPGKKRSGSLTIKPLALAGRRLTLNAIGGNGAIRAGLIGADGNAIAHYAVKDCNAVKGDALALPLSWGNRETLPQDLAPGVRLVLELTGDARLFGISVTGN